MPNENDAAKYNAELSHDLLPDNPFMRSLVAYDLTFNGQTGTDWGSQIRRMSSVVNPLAWGATFVHNLDYIQQHDENQGNWWNNSWAAAGKTIGGAFETMDKNRPITNGLTSTLLTLGNVAGAINDSSAKGFSAETLSKAWNDTKWADAWDLKKSDKIGSGEAFAYLTGQSITAASQLVMNPLETLTGDKEHSVHKAYNQAAKDWGFDYNSSSFDIYDDAQLKAIRNKPIGFAVGATGFALDVATDPFNYIGMGGGASARALVQGGLQGAKMTAKRVAAEGVRWDAVAKMGAAANNRNAREAIWFANNKNVAEIGRHEMIASIKNDTKRSAVAQMLADVNTPEDVAKVFLAVDHGSTRAAQELSNKFARTGYVLDQLDNGGYLNRLLLNDATPEMIVNAETKFYKDMSRHVKNPDVTEWRNNLQKALYNVTNDGATISRQIGPLTETGAALSFIGRTMDHAGARVGAWLAHDEGATVLVREAANGLAPKIVHMIHNVAGKMSWITANGSIDTTNEAMGGIDKFIGWINILNSKVDNALDVDNVRQGFINQYRNAGNEIERLSIINQVRELGYRSMAGKHFNNMSPEAVDEIKNIMSKIAYGEFEHLKQLRDNGYAIDPGTGTIINAPTLAAQLANKVPLTDWNRVNYTLLEHNNGLRTAFGKLGRGALKTAWLTNQIFSTLVLGRLARIGRDFIANAVGIVGSPHFAHYVGNVALNMPKAFKNSVTNVVGASRRAVDNIMNLRNATPQDVESIASNYLKAADEAFTEVNSAINDVLSHANKIGYENLSEAERVALGNLASLNEAEVLYHGSVTGLPNELDNNRVIALTQSRDEAQLFADAGGKHHFAKADVQDEANSEFAKNWHATLLKDIAGSDEIVRNKSEQILKLQTSLDELNSAAGTDLSKHARAAKAKLSRATKTYESHLASIELENALRKKNYAKALRDYRQAEKNSAENIYAAEEAQRAWDQANAEFDNAEAELLAAQKNFSAATGEHPYFSNYDAASDTGSNPFALMTKNQMDNMLAGHMLLDYGQVTKLANGQLAVTDRYTINVLPSEIAAKVKPGEHIVPVRSKALLASFKKRLDKGTPDVLYSKGFLVSASEAKALYEKELAAFNNKQTYFSHKFDWTNEGNAVKLDRVMENSHKATAIFDLSAAGQGTLSLADGPVNVVFLNGTFVKQDYIERFPKGTIFKYDPNLEVAASGKVAPLYAIDSNGNVIGMVQPQSKNIDNKYGLTIIKPENISTANLTNNLSASEIAYNFDEALADTGDLVFEETIPTLIKQVNVNNTQLEGMFDFLLENAKSYDDYYWLMKLAEGLVEHPNASSELLAKIASNKIFKNAQPGDDAVFTLLGIARNPNVAKETLLQLSKSRLNSIRSAVAANPNSDAKILKSVFKASADDESALAVLAGNSNLPKPILDKLAGLNLPQVNTVLSKNVALPEEQRIMLALSPRASESEMDYVFETIHFHDDYFTNVSNSSEFGPLNNNVDISKSTLLNGPAVDLEKKKAALEAQRAALGKRPADYAPPVKPVKPEMVKPWIDRPAIEIPTEISSELEVKAAKIQAELDAAEAARASALKLRQETLTNVNSEFNGSATNFAEASRLIKNSLPKQKANKIKVLSLFKNDVIVQQRVAGKWRNVSQSTVEKTSAAAISKREYRVIPAGSQAGTERFFVFGNKVDWTDPRNVPAELIADLGFDKPVSDFKKFISSGDWRNNPTFIKWMQDNNVGKIVVSDKKTPSGTTILALPNKIERGTNRPATVAAQANVEQALLEPGTSAVTSTITKRNLAQNMAASKTAAKANYKIPGLEEKHMDYATIEQNIRTALAGIADNRSTAATLLKFAGERRAKINATGSTIKKSVGQDNVRIGGRLAKWQGITTDGEPFEFSGALADPRTQANISSTDGWDTIAAPIGTVITEKNVAVRTAQVDPSDPNYFPAWEGTLNFHWRQKGTKVVDPFIRVLLEKGPDGAAKWLKSDSAGIAYAARMGVGKRFATVKETADNNGLGMLEEDYANMMDEEAKKLLPDTTIRNKFLNGEDISASYLIDNYGGALDYLQPITGRITEAYKSEMSAVAKSVRNMHKIISEIPQDALANAPFAQAAYRSALERGIVIAQKKYGENLPANVLAGIQHEATQSAVKDVKKWLYGAGEHSNLAEAARLLFPFAHAYSFTVRMLRNVMRENPVRAMYLFERGTAAVNGNDMHWVDKNGQPVSFNNADSLVINLTDSQRDFIGSIPGLSYIKDSKSQELRLSKKSMDVLFGGELLPGAGPLAIIPLSIFAVNNAAFWAHNTDSSFAGSVANYLKDYVLPYGPATDIASYVGVPIWMKKIFEIAGYNISKVTGWNVGAQEIAQNIARMKIEDDQMVKLHNTKPKTPEQIRQQAINFAIFQAVSNFVNPISTRAKTEFDVMTEKYRSYVDRFGILGPTYFRQDYPEWESVGASFSQNRYEVNPSKTSAENIKKFPEIMDLANEYSSESQNIVGWMLNVDGDTTFDDTVYTSLKSTSPKPGEPSFVTTMTPAEFQAKAEARPGWSEYNKGLDALNKIALDNGISIEQSPLLMEQKRLLVNNIATKNKSWYKEFNTIGNSKAANDRVHILLNAMGPNSNSAWYKANENKPEMQQVAQFLSIWQNAENILSQRLGINNSGLLTSQANKDISTWYYGEIAKLKADSIVFTSWYDKYIGDGGAPSGVGIIQKGTK